MKENEKKNCETPVLLFHTSCLGASRPVRTRPLFKCKKDVIERVRKIERVQKTTALDLETPVLLFHTWGITTNIEKSLSALKN